MIKCIESSSSGGGSGGGHVVLHIMDRLHAHYICIDADFMSGKK
jgi:hypothetical protein